MVHPKTALTLVAIAAFPAIIIFSNSSFFSPKNSSLIDVTTSADGINQQQVNYSWSIEKSTETKNLQLRIGDSYSPMFNIKITRENAASRNDQGVEGQVCIKNQGKKSTEGLQITSQVQYQAKRGGFQNLDGAVQTMAPDQISSGTKACFPLQISFTPPADSKKFRVKSEATVTNSARKHREFETSTDTDPFNIPQATVSTTNTATVTDKQTCPQDYECTPSDPGPWPVTDTKTITYTTLIKNVSADCTTPTSFDNEATLVENTTQNSTSSKSTIPINTGPC